MEDDLHKELSASLSLPTAGPLSGWPQTIIRQLVLFIHRHGLPVNRFISRGLAVGIVIQPRNTGQSIRVTVTHEARALWTQPFLEDSKLWPVKAAIVNILKMIIVNSA